MISRIEWLWTTGCVLVVTTALTLSGCSTAPQEGDSPADATTASEEAASDEELELDPLAALSEEDRALVELQKTCPVGGELGAMGTPVKVDVAGRPVFICCEHCREPLLADPDKYLAKLDAQASEESSEDAPAEDEGAENEAASEES